MAIRKRLLFSSPVEVSMDHLDAADLDAGLRAVVQELQDAQPDCDILASIQINRLVRCDFGRLQQVASNPLGNASTHRLARSPVKISARVEEADFLLEMWNSGERIPPESLSKVFEPFSRHSASASRNGLGLGLINAGALARYRTDSHLNHMQLLALPRTS